MASVLSPTPTTAIKYHSMQYPFQLFFPKVYFDDVKIGGKEIKIIFKKISKPGTLNELVPVF